MAGNVAADPTPTVPTATAEGGGWLSRFREGGGLGTYAWPAVTLVLLIGLWEFLSQTEVVNPIIVPPATEVFSALVDLVQEDFFWTATWVTVQETLIGFFIGVVGAWILGTLIGLFRFFRLAFYPL